MSFHWLSDTELAVMGRMSEATRVQLMDDLEKATRELTWLNHLMFECCSCPAQRCDRGDELAAAVRELMAPGETWEGIWRPRG